MQKWEYTEIRTKKYVDRSSFKFLQDAINDGNDEEINLYQFLCNKDAEECTEYLLNQLGAEGWELVNSLPSYQVNDEEYLQHILKRPLPNEVD